MTTPGTIVTLAHLANKTPHLLTRCPLSLSLIEQLEELSSTVTCDHKITAHTQHFNIICLVCGFSALPHPPTHEIEGVGQEIGNHSPHESDSVQVLLQWNTI